ncbi:hypothetical protein KI387_002125 [Taxus chinensis]|uniref:LOB domain-containing protein n=1 Tax=Taxus chinensis TaxID=29808 RepID=A0AA38GYA4_TAXCH|nr:hypothetical protein KI387_025963 [Taxus chinensis]KAH9330017.1 hypothetical protein KI387_002125 [Taxus chinensis]
MASATMSENFSAGYGGGYGVGSSGGAPSNQACAACKHQRRKCTENCPLAPFFPSEQSRRFQAVHKVFGVCNVLKILKRLDTRAEKQRAVESLCWEAECRERFPVDGCLGALNQLKMEFGKEKEHLETELQRARRQVESYARLYQHYTQQQHYGMNLQHINNNNPAVYNQYPMSQPPLNYYHGTALQQGGAGLSVEELLGVDDNEGGVQQPDVMVPQNLMYSMISSDTQPTTLVTQQQKTKTELPSA